MSKEEELQRFKVELEKQIKKGNEGNIKYCRLNIKRLEKEIAAQQNMHPTEWNRAKKSDSFIFGG